MLKNVDFDSQGGIGVLEVGEFGGYRVFFDTGESDSASSLVRRCLVSAQSNVPKTVTSLKTQFRTT